MFQATKTCVFPKALPTTPGTHQSWRLCPMNIQIWKANLESLRPNYLTDLKGEPRSPWQEWLQMQTIGLAKCKISTTKNSLNIIFGFRIHSLGYSYNPVHTEIYGTYRPEGGRKRAGMGRKKIIGFVKQWIYVCANTNVSSIYLTLRKPCRSGGSQKASPLSVTWYVSWGDLT